MDLPREILDTILDYTHISSEDFYNLRCVCRRFKNEMQKFFDNLPAEKHKELRINRSCSLFYFKQFNGEVYYIKSPEKYRPAKEIKDIYSLVIDDYHIDDFNDDDKFDIVFENIISLTLNCVDITNHEYKHFNGYNDDYYELHPYDLFLYSNRKILLRSIVFSIEYLYLNRCYIDSHGLIYYFNRAFL